MKTRFRAILLGAMSISFVLQAVTAFSQSYEIDAYNGQTVNTCSGTFYDSGGSGGNYGINENYSMTFCSANGQYLSFDFSLTSSALNLDAGTGDTLYFYDGTTASGTPIAFLTSSDDVAFTQLMINTLSTCVTVVWHSNGSTVDGGWAAVIACENPPSCSGNPPASDIFGQATAICNLNNYCGTTASYYGEDLPYNLNGGGTCPTPDDGIFGGTIENNSWLAFQATATTASFEFTVSNCSGDGIQVGIFGFNGSAFNLVSPCNLTDGSQGGTFTVTASALTIGSTYYIMIDGNAGATCDYIIHANTGVAVVSAGPDQNICVNNATMAAVAPNAGTGTWSTIAGSGTFANVNSPTSSVSGLLTGTNTFVWTIPSGACENVSDTVRIIVSAGSTSVISYATPFCITTTTAQPVTLVGTSGGAYTASPAGLSINATTGAITPSTSTAGTYTVTYTVASACGPATTTVVIKAVTTPTFTIASSLCSGSTAPLLPGTSTNGISGTWSPATVSNTTSGTYNFTPAAGQCALSASAMVTVTPGSNPTYTSSTVNVSCVGPNTGSITITPTSTGQTYDWVSGPVVSPVPAGNLPAGATDERALTNLPVGTYCVDISGGSSATTTQTLFTETFESGLSNWTLNNSNGTNIWVRNNSYTGGTCMVGATPFSCPTIPNQPAAVTGYPQSNYLHVKATTTAPVACGSGSSTPFPPLNANFNGSDGTADQKATLNTPINTTGLTNVTFNFYWMGDGDATDYGALEYSINGGTTWIQAGAKLNNQTTWIAGTRTDVSWANQSSLLFRFRWINNSSSSQDPPVCIDQITITGDQTSSCASTVQQCFTITAPSSVSPTFNAVAAVCQGATAPVLPTSSTNTPAITGSWSPAVSTATAGATSYTFTPAANQCATTATLSITVNPKPTILPTATPSAVCPGQSSSLSATGAASYTWNPGSLSGTPVSVSPSSLTVYTVTGTSAAGCTNTATVNISINASANITASAVPGSICPGQSTALSALGASTYTWTPGSLSGSPVNVSPSTSAVYTVTGTTAAGCVGTASVSVTVNTNPAVIATANPTAICNGQSTALSATGASTYTWMPGSLSGSPVNVSPTTTTTYTVTGVSALGCSGLATVTVTVNPTPTVTATATPSAVCVGQSTNLTGVGAASYAWSPAGQTGSPLSVTPPATSVYTVTGTSAAGCTGLGTVSVTVNPLPSVGASANPTTICSGGTSTLSGSGASTYTWTPGSLSGSPVNVSPSTSAVYTVTGTTSAGCAGTASVSVTVNTNPAVIATANPTAICNGQSTALSATGASTYTWMPGSLSGSPVNVSPTTTTTYTVTGVSALGCSGLATVTVTVNPTPTVTATATPSAVCVGQSTNLTGSGAASYAWSPAGQTGSPLTVTPPATSVYTVTGTSAAGCTGSGTVSVTVNPLPSVGASANPTTICAGGTSTLSGSGASTYTWTPGSLSGSPVNVSPSTSAVYTVTGTSAAGCTGSNTVNVNVNSLPNVNATAAPSTLCIGEGSILTATGATTYSWSHDSGSPNPSVIQPISTSTYTVTGTTSGCSNTAHVTVTVNQIPVINANASPDNICIGSNSTLTAYGADTYIWSPASSLSASAGNSVSAHPTTNTVYTVTGTLNGCTGSGSLTVNVYSSLVINVNPLSDTICNGSSTVLTASGALNYLWTPSASLSAPVGTSVTAAPTTTTTYYVTGTDAGGCSGSASAVVVLFNDASIPFLTLPKEGCAPLFVDFQYIPDGQIDTNTLHWNFGDPQNGMDVSGLTNPTYTYTQHGVYIVSLSGMSVYGCPVYDYDTVTVYKAPEADFMFHPQASETNDPLVDFFDQSVNASTWSWNFGDLGSGTDNYALDQYPSHTFSDSGHFSIQLVVTNENQCSDTAVKAINVRESYAFFMPSAFSPNGDGRNEVFIGQGVGIIEDEFDMYIYDRWGGEIFHSDNLLLGWDGRDDHKGELVEQGLYVWIVMLTDRKGIEHQLTGTVMMVR